MPSNNFKKVEEAPKHPTNGRMPDVWDDLLKYIFWPNGRYTVRLGYNELGYNELGYNELGYNEHSVITNTRL